MEYSPVHPLSMDSRNDNTHNRLFAFECQKRDQWMQKRRGLDCAMHDIALLSKRKPCNRYG